MSDAMLALNKCRTFDPRLLLKLDISGGHPINLLDISCGVFYYGSLADAYAQMRPRRRFMGTGCFEESFDEGYLQQRVLRVPTQGSDLELLSRMDSSWIASECFFEVGAS